MKLNLGANTDVRRGYVNIDNNPALANNPLIQPGDARNLQKMGVADGSVDEIVAIHLIEFMNPAEFPEALKSWAQALKPGGTLWVQSFDYDVVCNAIYHDRMDIGMANEILYGKDGKQCGIYNLPSVETAAENLGFAVKEKAYNAYEFEILLVKKVV